MIPKVALWGHFGSLLGHFGGPWAPLGTTLEHFGMTWDEFRSLLGYLESQMEIWDVIWTPFSVFVDIIGEY